MTGHPIEVVWGFATHAGLKRELNEDSALTAYPVFVVADGMGGYEAGELASAAVIAQFTSLAGALATTADGVRSALERARAAVEALPAGGGAGAGTTVTGVAVTEHAGNGYWLVLNIGDSRTYRLAGRRLEQLSVDHSVVQEMVAEGQITRDEARTHRDRNIITRAIGAGSASDADFWLLPAAEGDRIVVCSDGLSSEVDDALIAEIVSREVEPQAAADALVAAALAHGGKDNVTVIVVDATAVARGEADDEVDEDTIPRRTEEATDV